MKQEKIDLKLEIVKILQKTPSHQAHLSNLYSDLRDEFVERYKNESSFESTIRSTLEQYSSDSDNFKGKEDLFYSVLGKGKGVWGLREKDEIESIISDSSKEININDQHEIYGLRKVRTTQSLFRNKLFKIFNGQCVITAIDVPVLLVASHIKPWKESDDEEKLDEHNGLLLSVHLDKLFDKGLIGFNDKGDMVYRDEVIQKLVKNHFLLPQFKLPEQYLTPERKKYLQWHINHFGLVNCSLG